MEMKGDGLLGEVKVKGYCDGEKGEGVVEVKDEGDMGQEVKATHDRIKLIRNTRRNRVHPSRHPGPWPSNHPPSFPLTTRVHEHDEWCVVEGVNTNTNTNSNTNTNTITVSEATKHVFQVPTAIENEYTSTITFYINGVKHALNGNDLSPQTKLVDYIRTE